MMPGERPVEMLAQQLAGAFRCEMADVHERLAAGKHGLRMWLRSRIDAQTAFLLAIDQFEELFTFADPAARRGDLAAARTIVVGQARYVLSTTLTTKAASRRWSWSAARSGRRSGSRSAAACCSGPASRCSWSPVFF
jgi:hypothetical protein